MLAPDARKFLLSAIKGIRQKTERSEDQQNDFINSIAKAKNELGSKVQELQPGFKGWATIAEIDQLNRQIDKL